MQTEKEIRNKILQKSLDFFLQNGYSKVTMGEIANNAGISKKTLYKYFSNKENLFESIYTSFTCQNDIYIEQLFNNNEIGYVEKVKSILAHVSQHVAKLKGPLMQDLESHHPQMWKKIQVYMQKKAWEKFSILVEEGIKHGIFRESINKNIVVLVYVFSLQNLLTPSILSELPLSAEQVYNTLVNIIFEGILTEEGRTKFNNFEIEKIRINL